MESLGLLHLYYGDGKGKTTAAMGLALRALGSGKRVVIVQFLKGGQRGEIPLLEQLGATVYRGKAGQKFVFQMNEAEKAATRALQNKNLAAALAQPCDLLVLDEAGSAWELDMVDKALLQQAEQDKLKAEEEAKKAAEEAAASGEEQPKENKVTKIASGFLGVVVLIALAAGGGFYAFTKQKQKKQAEKEALDPDANYTEDKGDFEIPVEDEPEEPGEEDTEPI